MNSSERSGISQLRFLGYPVAEKLIGWSHLEPTAQTREATNKVDHLLEEGAVMVLDAHRRPFDMAATILYLMKYLKHLNPKIISPAAGGDYYHPLLHWLFSAYKACPKIDFLPVFRDHREIDHPKPRDSKNIKQLAEPHSLESGVLNIPYFKTVLQNRKTPGYIFLTAAFGQTTKDPSNPVTTSIIPFLQKGYPAVCALSLPRGIKCQTFLHPQIIQFHRQDKVKEEELNNIIHQQHKELLEHA